MIRLLIADDHLIIRQGLRLILETEDDFEIIADVVPQNKMLLLIQRCLK